MLRKGLVMPLLGAVLLGLAPATPVAAAPSCDPSDDICQQIIAATSQKNGISGQLADLDAKIKQAQANINLIAGYILQINNQVAAQQAAIDATQGRIDELDRQIRFTQADISRREAHLTVREALLDQRIRSMDKHGSINYLELVLTSANFNQLVDRVMLMQAVVRSDQQNVDQIKTERDSLKQANADLAVKRGEEAGLLATQQQQQADLEQLRVRQQQLLALQQAAFAQLDEQRKILEAQQQEINAQILLLQQQYDAAAAAVGGGSGQFGWPETTRYITQGYGCSSLLGEPYDPSCPTKHRHTGIDIGGPYGAPVYAADAGIVTFAGGNPSIGYGNYMILTHGNGYTTLYGHLSGFKLARGAIVGRGTVIGYEGSTGYSTGPHLHFEIRYNGAYVNPCAYLGC